MENKRFDACVRDSLEKLPDNELGKIFHKMHSQILQTSLRSSTQGLRKLEEQLFSSDDPSVDRARQRMRSLIVLCADSQARIKSILRIMPSGDLYPELDETPRPLHDLFQRLKLDPELCDYTFEASFKTDHVSLESHAADCCVDVVLSVQNHVLVILSLSEDHQGIVWKIDQLSEPDKEFSDQVGRDFDWQSCLGGMVNQQLKKPQSQADHLLVFPKTLDGEKDIPSSRYAPLLRASEMRYSDHHAAFLADRHKPRLDVKHALLDKWEEGKEAS